MTDDDWKSRARRLSTAAWEAVKEVNGGKAFVDTGTPNGKLSQMLLELAEHLGNAGKEIDSLRADIANAERRAEDAEARNVFLETEIVALAEKVRK